MVFHLDLDWPHFFHPDLLYYTLLFLLDVHEHVYFFTWYILFLSH